MLLFGIVPLFTEVKAQTENEIPDNMWDGNWFDNDYEDERIELDIDFTGDPRNPIRPPVCPDTLTLMTYNIAKKEYKENAKLIKQSNPDVVAVQEIHEILHTSNFSTLKKETGLVGCFVSIYDYPGAFITGAFTTAVQYGIALLWNPNRVGTPKISVQKIKSSKADHDPRRAYIIAEFNDFCFIATHYSSAKEPTEDRMKMTQSILNEDIVKNYRKPVYIAGDLNESPHNGKAIELFRKTDFEVLNDTTRNAEGEYEQYTRESKAMIDLILEKNTNPNREVIKSCRPAGADTTFKILSDHTPYVVKVKFR